MSIKKKFLTSAILMLIIPTVLIFIVTAVMLAVLQIFNPGMDIFSRDIINQPFFIKLIIVWVMVITVIVIFTGFGITMYLSRSILVPLGELKDDIKKLTNGSFDFEITYTNDSEISELCIMLDKLRIKLKDNVKRQLDYERERNMLIANISHDLKTPITSIKGYVEGVLDGVADTPEKRERYLKTVLSKTELMDELIDNLSMYSKLELKKVPFCFEYTDICEFISNEVTEYVPEFTQNEMEIETDIPNDSITVKIDRIKMRRVISNILSNAVKYKKEGSGKVKVSINKFNRGTVVSFLDNGIGIKKSETDKVFEGFYRSDSSRNSRIKGNGLGLSITKQIIEESGGKIWIKSREGIDTQVNIYLPVYEDGNTGTEKGVDTDEDSYNRG